MEILGIVGRQNSGKTTLITRLIPELKRRGLAVSTVKHAHHGFELDTPGKDTYRHQEAGAEEVLFTSSQRWVLMREIGEGPEPSLDELIRRMAPVDLVLVEGFKSLPLDKIEVRAAGEPGPTLQSADETVVAVVGGEGLRDLSVPAFGRDDTGAIADFIAARVDGASQA